MMKKVIVSLMFVIASIPLMAGGNVTLEIADNYFSRLAYTKAAEYYQKYLNKHEDNAYALFRLSRCYEMTNDYDKQSEILMKLVTLEDAETEAFLAYGQVLQLQGKFDKAAVQFEKYVKAFPDDRRAANQLQACRTAGAHADDKRYEIVNMEFNTELFEYGPNIFNKTLLYTSTTPEDNTTNRVNQWDGATYSDIKQFERDSSEIFIFFNQMDEVNTVYNDGIFSVDPETEDFYYTRNNYDPNKSFKKKGLNSQSHMTLNIYIAENHLGRIGKIREFQHNSDEYNTAHPTISRDGKYIVFVSDMPSEEAAGGRDLYFCLRDSAGWKAPQLLGEEINTEGDEIFPMFHDDGSLYFSSDGLGSIGGLDVFQAEIDFENNSVASVRRLESNINSTYDDFGIVFEDSRDGYFTSDRPGGKGKDDIYSFEDRQILLEGLVVDAETNKPIPNAEVKVERADGKVLFEGVADAEGKFSTFIYEESDYKLAADQDYYHDALDPFTSKDITGDKPVKVVIELEPVRYYVQVLDSETNNPVNGVMVSMDFGCNDDQQTVMTGVNGMHSIPVYKDCTYNLKAKTLKYLASRETWNSPEEDKDQTITIYIEEITFKPIVLHNIYYDFDKATLRLNESSGDLQKLLNFMRDNPELSVQINSHTDSRGSDSYNEKLSQERAQSVVNFLKTRRIAEDRVNARGYGENVPVNQCTNGVKCSEEEHQLNRRTEFQVVNADGTTKISSDARDDVKTDPCNNCPF